MQIVNVSYYAPTARVDVNATALEQFSCSNQGVQMNSIIFKVMMLGEQIKSFRKDDKGVTMIEYGLIAALVAVVCIGTITTLGTNLSALFGRIAAHLPGIG